MPEPLFLLGLLGAVYFYRAGRFGLCGLCGAIAVAARPNGFLVVAVFGILAVARLVRPPSGRRLPEAARMAGLLPLPVTLAAIYAWHQHLYGDWLASIHYVAGAFGGIAPRLYAALTYFGAGNEGVPYLFLLVLVGTLELVRRRELDLALLCAAFYLPSLFVPSDVSRYLLPVLPFAFFVAGARLLAAPPVRLALLASLPLVYFYAWKTVLNPDYAVPAGQFDVLRTIVWIQTVAGH
jgi:hypothetical protein